MNIVHLLVAAIVVIPAYAHAQGLQSFLLNFTTFIGGVLIPFLFGIAFLFFVINAVRFFVLQSSNEDGREKARELVTFSILAFVFLIIFWGILNLIAFGIGLGGETQPQSDYIQQNNGSDDYRGDDPCSINPSSPACSGTADTA
jgi:succinate dehydrogenase/fumarate reductase cytochrome b subunit